MKKTAPEKEQPSVPGKKKFGLGLKIPQIQSAHLNLVQPTEGTEPTQRSQATDPPTESTVPTQRSEPTEGSDTTLRTVSTERTPSTESTQRTESTAGSRRTERTNTTEGTLGNRPALEIAPVRNETAPMRDFQKVANSITRTAIPNGVFRAGKAKQLYDVLYSLTRGNIEPKRSIRLTRRKMMKLAGIGSDKTIDSILVDFKSKGLVRETLKFGEHQGNEYEIFTPDEVDAGTTYPTESTYGTDSSLGTESSSSQNIPDVPTVDSTYSTSGLIVDNERGSEKPKTLFKDLKNDDERKLSLVLDAYATAVESVTGEKPTSADWAAIGSLVEILTDETAIAASRTHSVSSYGQFAIANLRRRLYPKIRKSNSEAAPRFDPGKNDPSREVIVEPLPPPVDLSAEERERSLESLNAFYRHNDLEYLQSWKHLYTDADWDWLMENVSKDKV